MSKINLKLLLDIIIAIIKLLVKVLSEGSVPSDDTDVDDCLTGNS